MDDEARRRFTMAPKNPPKSNRSQLCVNSSSAKANQTKSFLFFFFFKSSKVSLQPKLNRNDSVFDVDVVVVVVNVVAADLVQVESRTDWRIVFASPYGRWDSVKGGRRAKV